MKRDEKEALVEEIGKEIAEAQAIFAIDYRGISVTQSAELRGKLREADASFRVVKNRLTKLAAAKAGVAELDPMLEGPTALTFVKGDTAMAAKAITTFNREYEVLTYKGGLMDGAELDEIKFKAIAKLPSRDALNAQLAGVVASPLVTLTRGLGSLISGLAIQLQQVADQELVGGKAEPEAPETAESAPEEAAAEEEAAEGAEAEESAEADETPEAESTEGSEEAGDGEAAAEADEAGEETDSGSDGGQNEAEEESGESEAEAAGAEESGEANTDQVEDQEGESAEGDAEEEQDASSEGEEANGADADADSEDSGETESEAGEPA